EDSPFPCPERRVLAASGTRLTRRSRAAYESGPVKKAGARAATCAAVGTGVVARQSVVGNCQRAKVSAKSSEPEPHHVFMHPKSGAQQRSLRPRAAHHSDCRAVALAG